MDEPPKSDTSRTDARAATSELALRIAAAKRDHEAGANRARTEASPEMTGLARGMRIGTEFVAAILVGTGVGYLIDLGLGTSPWGLLILFMVGFAAGIRNVIRAVTEMNAAAPAPPPGSDLGPDDAEGEERDR